MRSWILEQYQEKRRTDENNDTDDCRTKQKFPTQTISPVNSIQNPSGLVFASKNCPMSNISHNRVLRICLPLTFLVLTYVFYGLTGTRNKFLFISIWRCVEARRGVSFICVGTVAWPWVPECWVFGFTSTSMAFPPWPCWNEPSCVIFDRFRSLILSSAAPEPGGGCKVVYWLSSFPSLRFFWPLIPISNRVPGQHGWPTAASAVNK